MKIEPTKKRKPRLVTVCDKCLRASCWNGIFMCDESTNAGITQRTVNQLRALGYENECYWKEYREAGR